MCPGVPPPYESVSEYEPGKVVEDWLWATGHTPFGPYSNTTTLSDLTVTVARRNVILASVERVMGNMNHVMSFIREFLDENACPPFYELGIEHGRLEAKNASWIDKLYTWVSLSCWIVLR